MICGASALTVFLVLVFVILHDRTPAPRLPREPYVPNPRLKHWNQKHPS